MEKESKTVTCPLCNTQGVIIEDLEDLQEPINEIKETREEIRQEREEEQGEKLEDAFEAQYGEYLKPYRNNAFWKRIAFNLALSAILFIFLFGGNTAIKDLNLFDIFKLALYFIFVVLVLFNNAPFFKKSKEEEELRKSLGL